MPSDTVLRGLSMFISYFMSHSVVVIPETQWTEPVLLWITIAMPTGSGKTALFTYLSDLVKQVKEHLESNQDLILKMFGC